MTKFEPQYDPIGRGFPELPDAQLLGEARPVVVELGPEDIAVMHSVRRLSPYEFNQELLRRLREAGAAVEGQVVLRLAHGALYRVRGDVGRFRYIWMPQAYHAGIEAMKKGLPA